METSGITKEPTVTTLGTLTAKHVAVVVVPGGCGHIFAHSLRGADEIGVVLSGAALGEAGVDFVVIHDGPALARLECGMSCPVIAVMALISCCAPELAELKAATEHSERWSSALSLWRCWRGLDADRTPSSFRATVLRADGLSAPPSVNEIARAAGAGCWRRWQWTVSMTAWELEICTVWLGSYVLCGLPLTPGWCASAKSADKKCFWPPEYTVTTRPGAPAEYGLRPSVSHAMLRLAQVQPTDVNRLCRGRAPLLRPLLKHGPRDALACAPEPIAPVSHAPDSPPCSTRAGGGRRDGRLFFDTTGGNRQLWQRLLSCRRHT